MNRIALRSVALALTVAAGIAGCADNYGRSSAQHTPLDSQAYRVSAQPQQGDARQQQQPTNAQQAGPYRGDSAMHGSTGYGAYGQTWGAAPYSQWRPIK